MRLFSSDSIFLYISNSLILVYFIVFLIFWVSTLKLSFSSRLSLTNFFKFRTIMLSFCVRKMYLASPLRTQSTTLTQSLRCGLHKSTQFLFFALNHCDFCLQTHVLLEHLVKFLLKLQSLGVEPFLVLLDTSREDSGEVMSGKIWSHDTNLLSFDMVIRLGIVDVLNAVLTPLSFVPRFG